MYYNVSKLNLKNFNEFEMFIITLMFYACSLGDFQAHYTCEECRNHLCILPVDHKEGYDEDNRKCCDGDAEYLLRRDGLTTGDVWRETRVVAGAGRSHAGRVETCLSP